jgi:phage tail tape-measure protein
MNYGSKLLMPLAVATTAITAGSALIDGDYKGVARSVGGLGGAYAGAAAGAALGSVVPVIGTAIGGLIGGAVGYFAGSELTDLVTGLFDDAEAPTDAPKEAPQKQDGDSVKQTVNRRFDITVHAAPGEDAESLAVRVAELVEERELMNQSGALFDD